MVASGTVALCVRKLEVTSLGMSDACRQRRDAWWYTGRKRCLVYTWRQRVRLLARELGREPLLFVLERGNLGL